MDNKERHTSQKKVIIDYLRKVKCHPSADKVYKEVKKKLPRISKGTVYRILNNFKAKGEIKEIPLKICRYDGDLSVHAHFFCKSCGKVFDVWDKITLPKKKKLKVGQVTNYLISYYGICEKCQKSKK